MTSKFWKFQSSINEVFNDLLADNPTATLWDIFTDYNPVYETDTPADTSSEWLQKQESLIKEVLSKHLSQQAFCLQDIECLTEEILDISLPEEAYLDDFKYHELATKIAETYIIPYKLNEPTLRNFLDVLAIKLEALNKDHIFETKKEEMRQLIRVSVPEDKIEAVLQNIDLNMEDFSEEDDCEDSEDDEDIDDEDIDADDFIHPVIGLALSDTFFGFNDAGDLSYEEQEQIASKKFNRYVSEMTQLLQQQPDKNLQPNNLFSDIANEDEIDWGNYYELLDSNPFAYQFEGEFLAWKKDNKVLFLSMTKEDKELPYDIILGGLSLDKYKQILTSYNSIKF